jgi:glyoxylase-like metal-dependent hydrolase (beta-lactamase superfamily II)
MRVRKLATGLWYWTGRHPAWTPADGGPDGWEQEVGCVYYEGPDTVVLFDPLVPMEDRDRFYEALDRDVERTGKPVRVLLTVDAHVRSSEELAARYGASVGERPEGVQLGAEAWNEIVYWLPEHAAFVAGDVLIARDGRLEVPRAWVGDDYDDAVEALRPLLELPVERVLVTHGEPVLVGARESLTQALAG